MNNSESKGFAVYTNSFKFKYPKCDIKKNSYTDKKGSSIRDISVRNIEDERISFHFKNALFKENDFSDSENILLEFIAINFGDEEKLIDFFNKNGFLFETSFNEYTTYAYDTFYLIAKRLRLVIELILETQKKEPSSEIILNHIFHFLLTPPTSLKVEDNLIYSSYDHGVAKALINSGILSNSPDTYEWGMEEYESFVPNPKEFYFDNEAYLNFYHHQLVDNYGRAYSAILEDEYTILHLVADIIRTITLKNGAEFFEEDIIKFKSIHSKNRRLITSVTENIIKNEIDHHVKRIVPSYNIDNSTGGWSFPDLLSAIYFSLFFFNPEFELIKKCENPTCSNYYTILNSNKRKKYCSPRCANAVNQRKHRARKNAEK